MPPPSAMCRTRHEMLSVLIACHFSELAIWHQLHSLRRVLISNFRVDDNPTVTDQLYASLYRELCCRKA